MTAVLAMLRTGPLTTIQDEGRFGMLRHGISAAGPMDRGAYAQAGCGGRGAIEVTRAGLEFRVASGACQLGFAGGSFRIAINQVAAQWPGMVSLVAGDVVSVTPGPSGNYGYLRFDTDLIVPGVMGSIATSSRARLGGLGGRALQAGDALELAQEGSEPLNSTAVDGTEGPLRFIWGLHAELFGPAQRQAFLAASFTVSSQMDRMGIRLEDATGVFSGTKILSLVSDAIVPGDVQILGDGTPIVLMRDHQPTGGYPRVATIVTADLDRFAQLRPGSSIAFVPVTVNHAHDLLRGRR